MTLTISVFGKLYIVEPTDSFTDNWQNSSIVQIARVLVRRVVVHQLSVSPTLDTLIQKNLRTMIAAPALTEVEMIDEIVRRILPYLRKRNLTRETLVQGPRSTQPRTPL